MHCSKLSLSTICALIVNCLVLRVACTAFDDGTEFVEDFTDALECIPFHHEKLRTGDFNVRVDPLGDVSWMSSMLIPAGAGPIDLTCNDPVAAAVYVLYCQYLRNHSSTDQLVAAAARQAELSYELCTEELYLQRRRLQMCCGVEQADFYQRFVSSRWALMMQRMACSYIAGCGLFNYESLCQIYLIPLFRQIRGCHSDVEVLQANCLRKHPNCFSSFVQASAPSASSKERMKLRTLWATGECPRVDCRHFESGCSQTPSSGGTPVHLRANVTNMARLWLRRRFCAPAISASRSTQTFQSVGAETDYEQEIFEKKCRMSSGSSSGGTQDDGDARQQHDALLFAI